MKNIILVTGTISDGKTVLIGRLRQELARLNIPQALSVISDGSYLLEAIKQDHKLNHGRNHMHEGQSLPGAHDHEGGSNKYDFVSAGKEIQTFMLSMFFDHLASVRDSGPLVFAELAGGRGEFKEGDPLAANDYSYQRMVRGLKSGEFATDWIDHLRMVIHPSSEFTSRLAWNRDRLEHPPTEEDIRGARASWGVPERVMYNTKYDDFEVFGGFLESRGVARSCIETITNGGNPEFFGKAMVALEREGVVYSEGNLSRKELR